MAELKQIPFKLMYLSEEDTTPCGAGSYSCYLAQIGSDWKSEVRISLAPERSTGTIITSICKYPNSVYSLSFNRQHLPTRTNDKEDPEFWIPETFLATEEVMQKLALIYDKEFKEYPDRFPRLIDLADIWWSKPFLKSDNSAEDWVNGTPYRIDYANLSTPWFRNCDVAEHIVSVYSPYHKRWFPVDAEILTGNK